MHKYGIKIPTSADHAYKINRNNKDKLWRNVIRKEMRKIGITFEILYRDRHMPVVCKRVTGNMAFGVKMDFTRKSHWVLYGGYSGLTQHSLLSLLPHQFSNTTLSFIP